MTQEEKQLLLTDICARLPYGVIYHRNDGANIELREVDVKIGNLNYTDNIVVRECKPYLRPMSSMTKKERQFLLKFGTVGMDENDKVFDVYPFGMEKTMPVIDYLNAHHFDYRGLIEKGLALEAPEGMY